MSANNQTLVVQYKDKWLVYENIMAETWCSNDDCTRKNELNLSSADGTAENKEDAIMHAHEIDDSEYGVTINQLAKDGAEVVIIDDVMNKQTTECKECGGTGVDEAHIMNSSNSEFIDCTSCKGTGKQEQINEFPDLELSDVLDPNDL